MIPAGDKGIRDAKLNNGHKPLKSCSQPLCQARQMTADDGLAVRFCFANVRKRTVGHSYFPAQK
jgi:hypothetical protein